MHILAIPCADQDRRGIKDQKTLHEAGETFLHASAPDALLPR